jgi:hypothetical protein
MVLPITPSFLVRFRPVNYRIEALIAFYTMVRGWSVRFSFWSGQRSGQTSVKLGQTWSIFSKLSGNVSRAAFQGFSGIVDHSWVRNSIVNPWSNLVNPGQTWLTLVKFGQTLGNVSWTFFLGVFDVVSPRWIWPAQFGLSCFACRHSRKSRG